MDNPIIHYRMNGNVEYEEWYDNDSHHRLNEPAVIYYGENGNIENEYWYKNGQRHRLDGPASIFYWENGNIKYEDWYIKGKQINPPYDNYPLTTEQQIEMKLIHG